MWKCGYSSRNNLKWLNGSTNKGKNNVTDVSVVPSRPVMIKVVISAAGVCAFRSCSAVGFCFFFYCQTPWKLRKPFIISVLQINSVL